MTHSDQLDQLATALAKAQQQIEGAKKDSTNPFFKSTYADLASVWAACRGALTQNGLSVVQLPGFDSGVATLTTILLHSSGQWIEGTAAAPIAKQDAQGVGGVITYLRRYALAAVAGVVQEDDDGESAVVRGKPAAGGQGVKAKDAKPAPAVRRSLEAIADARQDDTQDPQDRMLLERQRAWELRQRQPLSEPPKALALPTTWKGNPLTGMDSDTLVGLREFMVRTPKKAPPEDVEWTKHIEAIDLILDSRRGE